MKKFTKMKTTLAILASGLIGIGLVGCSGQGAEEVPPVEEPPVVEEPTITVPLGSYVGEKGSIIPSVLSAEVGEVVTYTITPARNYDLFNIKVNGNTPGLVYDAEKDVYTFD